MKREDLLAHAATLKLDIARFTADLDSDKYSAVIARDMKEGAKVGVEGTPTFFINGAPVVGAQPFEKFTAAIDKALAAPAATPSPKPSSPKQ
jgi:protein-disulfide isomerase